MTLQDDAARLARVWLSLSREAGWQGWDPYDGLRLPWYRAITFNSKLLRQCLIQFMKRFPVNIRPFLGMTQHVNPKALALFAMAAADLNDPVTHQLLLEELHQRRTNRGSGFGWGYPFDWQSRAFFVPAGTPNLVVTSFVGQALLDAYAITNQSRWLEMAAQACRFITSALYRAETPEGVCFSYTPLDRSRIDNANLLAAALLTRTGKAVGQAEWTALGLAAAQYTAARQQPDGSWTYGEAADQNWIDHFHTGFNLVCLKQVAEASGQTRHTEVISKGLRFYLDHFFDPDGGPRYWANESYPYDAHSAAQALITLTLFEKETPECRKRADQVCEWTLRRMIDKNTSRVAFQIHRAYSNWIPYRRWAMAWMTHAFARYARNRS